MTSAPVNDARVSAAVRHSARSSRLAASMGEVSSAKPRSHTGLLRQSSGNPSCNIENPISCDLASMKSAKSTTSDRSGAMLRSEEHTSELQSRFDLVCRLLLEKKKT